MECHRCGNGRIRIASSIGVTGVHPLFCDNGPCFAWFGAVGMRELMDRPTIDGSIELIFDHALTETMKQHVTADLRVALSACSPTIEEWHKNASLAA